MTHGQLVENSKKEARITWTEADMIEAKKDTCRKVTGSGVIVI